MASVTLMEEDILMVTHTLMEDHPHLASRSSVHHPSALALVLAAEM